MHSGPDERSAREDVEGIASPAAKRPKSRRIEPDEVFGRDKGNLTEKVPPNHVLPHPKA